MATLKVHLGERSYPIYIDRGILVGVGEFIRQAGIGGKVAVVTNPTVASLYLETIIESLREAKLPFARVLVPDGEEHKNLSCVSEIYDHLVCERLDRQSCILALGGGVIGDMAGFVAATYLRGIPYIQVPTTLLAQVDSSVGGKTGVNHQNGKNLIGAFYQPRMVVIDVDVLSSLPRRELIAGLAEVIKYGVIEDADLFTLLEAKLDHVLDLDPDLLIQIISTSCAIKARIVENDEREADYRAVLNFGHTIGHALEAVTGYQRFLHGEAVGIGMAQAAAISFRRGFCNQASFERIRKLIERAGLPVEIPPDVSKDRLIEAMEVDKKSAGGKIKFVICGGLGKTGFHSLTPQEILAALG
jgi:3-dehydroquinate synthase